MNILPLVAVLIGVMWLYKPTEPCCGGCASGHDCADDGNAAERMYA